MDSERMSQPNNYSAEITIKLSGTFHSEARFDELKAKALTSLNGSVVYGLKLTVPLKSDQNA